MVPLHQNNMDQLMLMYITQSHRISKVGKDLGNHQVHPVTKHHLVNLSPCQLDHVTRCHVESFNKHIQEWSLHHLPGQPIPITNHSFCEDV